MTIALLPVSPDTDGVLALLDPPVTTRDLQTVESMQGFVSETAPVRVGDEIKQLAVYRDARGRTFLRADAI